jgi:transposase
MLAFSATACDHVSNMLAVQKREASGTVNPPGVAELLMVLVDKNAEIGIQQQTIGQLEEQIAKLKSQIDWMQRQLFGRKSEKIDPNQMWLDALTIEAVENNPPAAPAPAVEQTVAAHTRKVTPHGRQELPAHLPREVETIDVPEAEKVLPDGTPRPPMGHEDTERVAYTPGRVFVKVTRRLKYGSPLGAEENGVVIAPTPERLLPRCLADESMVAHFAVSKFADHLPLHRLEAILRRSQVNLPRQTTCGWLVEGGLAIQPLVDAMVTQLFASGLVHSDDTPVDLQDYDSDKPRGQRMREARLWVTTVAPREGPWTVFDFTLNRATAGPMKFFMDYRGQMVCDAYAVYNAFEKLVDPLALVGCWAHVRRYFLKAHQTDHPAIGAEFVALIGELYRIERELSDTQLAADATDENRAAARMQDNACRLEARQMSALPVLNRIRARIDALLPGTPPSSKLGKALAYTDKIWDRLIAYADDGRLPIDNNAAEQMIRPVALGRNNWLFFGSERGGKAGANWMSIIATCKRAKVEPFAYLCDMLRRLPVAKTPDQVRALLPDVWKPA